MKDEKYSAGQMIADGWGNRRALEAEEAIKAIEAEMTENDSKLESGELEFEVWKEKQAELREKISPQQRIIREEKAKYHKLLSERRVA